MNDKPNFDAEQYKEAQDFEKSAFVVPLELFQVCRSQRDAARAEIEAMREAIKSAYDSLEWATRTMNPPFEWEPFTRANEALDRLKPYIK